jgi:hypothetical protein
VANEALGRKYSSLTDKVGLHPGLGPYITITCQFESFLLDKQDVTFEYLEHDGRFTVTMGGCERYDMYVALCGVAGKVLE